MGDVTGVGVGRGVTVGCRVGVGDGLGVGVGGAGGTKKSTAWHAEQVMAKSMAKRVKSFFVMRWAVRVILGVP
ncbi:MAG: hypothetical protein U9R15_16495 [Chloroflexota bacterium]|nr:hypothetical protein [Chloroflexota bacterium]